MSRTYKDRPAHVIERIALKKGRVSHDHSGIGTHSSTVRIKDTVLTKKFLKSERAEINAYKESVASVPGVDKVWEEEVPGKIKAVWVPTPGLKDGYMMVDGVRVHVKTYDPACGIFAKIFYPKTIIVHVSAKFERGPRFSDKCTDAAHYDEHRSRDVRDGRRVSCSPDICGSIYFDEKGRHRGGGGWSADNNGDRKTKISDALSKARRAYNSGSHDSVADVVDNARVGVDVDNTKIYY